MDQRGDAGHGTTDCWVRECAGRSEIDAHFAPLVKTDQDHVSTGLGMRCPVRGAVCVRSREGWFGECAKPPSPAEATVESTMHHFPNPRPNRPEFAPRSLEARSVMGFAAFLISAALLVVRSIN